MNIVRNRKDIDMKEKLTLVIKGFFVGIANLIPGVSGGTLALTLGIYEKLIGTISHFFKNFKKNMAFLLPLLIGAGLSILFGSKVLSSSLKNFPFATNFFFIGLILGGIPLLTKKIQTKKKSVSNFLIFFLTFAFVILLGLFQQNGSGVSFAKMDVLGYVLLFFVGMIAAATMVIPGVSGSMVLLLLGYYYPILKTIEQLTHFKNLGQALLILLPFGLGIVVGIVAIAKLLEFLFARFETKTYYGVLGFVSASIVTLLFAVFPIQVAVGEVLVGAILLLVGLLIGLRLGGE